MLSYTVLVFYMKLKLNDKRVKYSAYSMEGEAVGRICVSLKQAGVVWRSVFLDSLCSFHYM